MMDSEGWMAWAKRSEVRGRVQMVSYIIMGLLAVWWGGDLQFCDWPVS